MKVLLYGINFSPELTGIGKYSGEMAAWLASNGHEVRMVTAPPYYPDWKVGEGFSACAWTLEHWEGVGIWRCPLWIPRHPGGAKRLLHLASFALTSFPAMMSQLWWRPDVVWVVEPPLICAPTALMVARLTRARCWLHIQDYELDAAFALGLLKGQWLLHMLAMGERWLMRQFDVVSTISWRMLERAYLKGLGKAKCVFLPNWVDLASFYVNGETSGSQNLRTRLHLPANVVVALYSGNMGNKQGLEVLAQVAQLCASPKGPANHVHFVFCGAGVGRADLEARCKGLENVQFLDLQPAERLPGLLALADIHLLPQRSDAADLVMPSKLTGMLASARPVVATAWPETELARVVTTCGLVVPPGDPSAMANAVLELATDSTLRARLGAAGRAYAERNLNRETVLRDFEVALLELLKNRRKSTV